MNYWKAPKTPGTCYAISKDKKKETKTVVCEGGLSPSSTGCGENQIKSDKYCAKSG